MSRLADRTAVITGGSSGIGLVTAQRFVDEVAYVFIVGRRQAELDNAVQQIGRNESAVQADVTKLEDLDRLYSVARGGTRQHRRFLPIQARSNTEGSTRSRPSTTERRSMFNMRGLISPCRRRCH
ncbi:SDR family NAD(P)-dependent oxidoreductase [Paraburkholderia diazotrophica]|uniref:SDR family NAD(P)-dependent oxidoreductase n=1 Tax=Paraburkholderia diazotrophica TaxID=667676 RepID=UPI003898FC70